MYTCILTHTYTRKRKQETKKEWEKGKQIILCRGNPSQVLVARGNRNYRALIGDGLRIFVFVNETLTRNFRRILTFPAYSAPHPAPDPLPCAFLHRKERLKRNTFRPQADILLTVFNFQRRVGVWEINARHDVISFIRKARNEGFAFATISLFNGSPIHFEVDFVGIQIGYVFE